MYVEAKLTSCCSLASRLWMAYVNLLYPSNTFISCLPEPTEHILQRHGTTRFPNMLHRAIGWVGVWGVETAPGFT